MPIEANHRLLQSVIIKIDKKKSDVPDLHTVYRATVLYLPEFLQSEQ